MSLSTFITFSLNPPLSPLLCLRSSFLTKQKCLSEVLLWCSNARQHCCATRKGFYLVLSKQFLLGCKSRINTRSVYVSPSLQMQQQQRSRGRHLCFYSRKTTTYVNKAQTTHMCALINHKVTQIHLIQTSGCRWMNTGCIQHVFFY